MGLLILLGIAKHSTTKRVNALEADALGNGYRFKHGPVQLDWMPALGIRIFLGPNQRNFTNLREQHTKGLMFFAVDYSHTYINAGGYSSSYSQTIFGFKSSACLTWTEDIYYDGARRFGKNKWIGISPPNKNENLLPTPLKELLDLNNLRMATSSNVVVFYEFERLSHKEVETLKNLALKLLMVIEEEATH